MKTNVSKSKLVRSVIFIILVSMFIISGILAGCAVASNYETDTGEVSISDPETPTDPKGPELLEPLDQEALYQLWQRHRYYAFLAGSNGQARRLQRSNTENGIVVVRYRYNGINYQDNTDSIYSNGIERARMAINSITRSLYTPIIFVATDNIHADTHFNIQFSDVPLEEVPGRTPGTNELNDGDDITSSNITLYRSVLGAYEAGNPNHNADVENYVLATMLRLLGNTLGLRDIDTNINGIAELESNSVMYPTRPANGWLTQYQPFDIANIRGLYDNVEYTSYETFPTISIPGGTDVSGTGANDSSSGTGDGGTDDRVNASTIWSRRNRLSEMYSFSEISNNLYARAPRVISYYLIPTIRNTYYFDAVIDAINEVNRVTNTLANPIFINPSDYYITDPQFTIGITSDSSIFGPPGEGRVLGANFLGPDFSQGFVQNPHLGDHAFEAVVGYSHIYLDDNELRLRNNASLNDQPNDAARARIITVMIHELLHTLGLEDLYNRPGHNDPDYQRLVPYSVMAAGRIFTNIPPYDIANLRWRYDGYVSREEDFNGASIDDLPTTPPPPPGQDSNTAIGFISSQDGFNNWNDDLGFGLFRTTNGGSVLGQSVTDLNDIDREKLARLSPDTKTVTYNYKFDVSASDDAVYVRAIERAMSMINSITGSRYLKNPITFQAISGNSGEFIIDIKDKYTPQPGQELDPVRFPGDNAVKCKTKFISGSTINLYRDVLKGDEDYVYRVMLNLLGQTLGFASHNIDTLASKTVMHQGQLQKDKGIMGYTMFDIANLRWLYDEYISVPSNFQNISIATPVQYTAPEVSEEYQYDLWKIWGGTESFGLSSKNKLKYLETNTNDDTTVTYRLYYVIGNDKNVDIINAIKVYKDAIQMAMDEINKVTGNLDGHKIYFKLYSTVKVIDAVPDPDDASENFNIYICENSKKTYASLNHLTTQNGGIYKSSISLYRNLLCDNKDMICAEALHSLMHTLGLAWIRNSSFWGNSVMYIEPVQRLTKLTAFDIANIKWRYDGFKPKDLDDFLNHCSNDPIRLKGTEGLKYVLNADGKSYTLENIGTAKDKEIIIPSTYNGLPVTEIEKFAFKDCTFVTSITIPKSVTFIGEGVFYGCTSLTSIDIPNSVLFIGPGAFSGCKSLTSVNIPNSVNFILDFSFYGCTSLTSIDIPNSVSFIGVSSFYGCTSLTSINIPDSVKEIRMAAFEGCTSLSSVELPNSITSIKEATFKGCTSLTHIDIPYNVINIGREAFANCIYLADIKYNGKKARWDKTVFKDDTWATKTGAGTSKGTYTMHYYPDELNGDATEGLKYVLNTDGKSYSVEIGTATQEDIFIAAEYEGLPVTGIGNYAFKDCTFIRSIDIPDSVTTIGEYAFYGCTSLESIDIPDSVTSIGNYAFEGCSVLANIYFNSTKAQWNEIKKGTDWDKDTGNYTIHYIGEGTEGLKYVLNSDGKSYSLENIGTATDKDIVIASEYEGLPVTGIESYAFKDCTFITSITIPDSVTIIREFAFYGCTSLASMYIPNSVIAIGSFAFSGCASLTSVVIPNGVTSIEYYAFSGCASLTSIVIPNGVTFIGSDAFSGCSSLTSVTIPDSVTSIGIGIFRDCTSLSSVIISNSIKSIENYTFESCTSLTSVVIPDSVTIIGEFAFFDCKSLTSVVIPDSVTVIGEAAFVVCTSLTSVVIPDSVTLIEIDAFAECSALTDIYYEGTKAQWNNIKKEEDWDRATGKYTVHYLGEGTKGLKYILNEDGKSYTVENIGTATDEDIVIPSEHEGLPVTAIDCAAFKDCTFITSVYIPDSVTSIGDNAFNGCISLKSVTIPDSITTIGEQAFYGCTSLTSVKIPNSVTHIGDQAFGRCTTLASVEISNSITTIELGTFAYCSALTHVTIPNGVETISTYAFYNCTSLTGVEIANSVKTINGAAFKGCTSLTSVDIPNSVTFIDVNAFQGCTSLASIEISDSITTISRHAFADCSALRDIYFKGTKAQWDKISKGSDWNKNSGNYTIHCTDGDIAKG